MKYFIPEYGSYFHFMTESVMGLYRLLVENNQLKTRDFEFWYKGSYSKIIQLFSKSPVQIIQHPSQVPSGVKTFEHIRLKVEAPADWLQLRSLAAYLKSLFPHEAMEPGITIIKRSHRRRYSDHNELVQKLNSYGLPVREAVLELMPLNAQINLMRNTRILVGPHGAGQTNMMFMPDGSKLLELYPMGFSCKVYQALSRAFGHELVELESQVPSVIGRKPTPEFLAHFEQKGWPARKDFQRGLPSIEFRRVLRDVSSFSINPALVVQQLGPWLDFRH